MRVPSLAAAMLSRVFRGTIMQRGDAELDIPSILQRIALVSQPFNDGTKAGGATQVESSFATDNQITANGVAVAQTVNVATLARGGWRIILTPVFNSPTMTTNLARQSYVALQPPGITLANSPKLWAVTHQNSSPNLSPVISMDLILPGDGWVIVQNMDATVALDSISFNLGVIALKFA